MRVKLMYGAHHSGFGVLPGIYFCDPRVDGCGARPLKRLF